jgi:hypothetical protein
MPKSQVAFNEISDIIADQLFNVKSILISLSKENKQPVEIITELIEKTEIIGNV